MSLFSRISRGISVGLQAARTAPDMKTLEVDLEKLSDQIITEEKQSDDHPSKLAIRTNQQYLAMSYGAMLGLKGFSNKKLAPHGDPNRDYTLSEIWKDEPILSGAVYSMTAKMSSLRWFISGRRRIAKQYARMLASAAFFDGYDWGGFISSTAEDFYTTDRGVFWETPRDGFSRLMDLGHIDCINCTLTGSKVNPMVYGSDTTGQIINFKSDEYLHFASLPSSREMNLGIGFCAVSRAYRAAKLLITVHDYDEQKLSNLPPEGVATVSGLTMQEFTDAIQLWKAAREQNQSLTFPQVLWLLGSQPNTEVKVALQAFSSLPESFDRQKVVDQYVSVLALCFGVDAREFWPISSGALGTASETEIQHQKARGKGPGEFITLTERHINSNFPDDADFRYDTQDIEEDVVASNVAKAWIQAYWPLYAGIPNPNAPAQPQQPQGMPGQPAGQVAGQPAGERPVEKQRPPTQDNPKEAGGQPPATEQVITKAELLRLLADKGVLPDYLVNDERVVIYDTDVHIKSDEGNDEDMTRYVWDNGVLKETRLPPIILRSSESGISAEIRTAVSSAKVVEVNKNGNGSVSEADFESIFLELKQKADQIMEGERNIRGEPVPDRESERGARVTAATIRDELARWRKHPILSKYALTSEEEKVLLESVGGAKIAISSKA